MRFKDIRSSYSNVLSSLAQVPTIEHMSTELDFWPVDRADKLRIIKRFPDRWSGVSALYEKSEDFRLLCHEYGLATDALSRLSSHEDVSPSRKRDEYEQIVRELDSEILNYIDEKVT